MIYNAEWIEQYVELPVAQVLPNMLGKAGAQERDALSVLYPEGHIRNREGGAVCWRWLLHNTAQNCDFFG